MFEPPPPAQKSFLDRSHGLFAFHLGLPGSLEADERAGDSASTYGFNLRSDLPVAGYLLVGPMVQMGAWKPDPSDVNRSYYVDLDLVLRLRLPIMTKQLNYQLWVGMPVGVTVDVLGEQLAETSSVGVGWNIGVLFGGAVHLTPKFGLFAEAGWLQHRFSHSADPVQDLDIVLQQWCLNLGIIVRE